MARFGKLGLGVWELHERSKSRPKNGLAFTSSDQGGVFMIENASQAPVSRIGHGTLSSFAKFRASWMKLARGKAVTRS